MINDIDEKFAVYFRNLKQVFLYITDDCNLECRHCIYKPNIRFSLGNKDIPFDEAIALLYDFRKLGAIKLSILGGEPTMYGYKIHGDYEYVLRLIHYAKEIGYEYVRIVTNGTFSHTLLDEARFKLLDEITFSVDGYDKNSNDAIRGSGVYNAVVNNILKAKSCGYNIHITACVYGELLKRDEDGGDMLIERIIFLAEKLGANAINFHVLINDGTPIETWQGGLYCEPFLWESAYNEIVKNIEKGKYNINVRIPQTFIDSDEFDANKEYYGFCPAKLGERVLVHPDGMIRICSALLSTKYGVATFNNFKIEWNYGKTNELNDHLLNEFTPCSNRGKVRYGEGRCVLCFSFKPNQSELVWRDYTKWDAKVFLLH
jgi:MoaA/NifB/PqqE/SkfB family radical SAM enzyme